MLLLSCNYKSIVNKIGDMGVSSLSESLMANTTLVMLDLSGKQKIDDSLTRHFFV